MHKQRAVIFKVAWEHRRNDEILEETKVEPIAVGLGGRRLEWFGHVKAKDETEEGLAGNGITVGRDTKVWKIREIYATGRENHV